MTQNETIRAALLAGRAITPLEALHEFGCLRLAARIRDLRQTGMDIECKNVIRNGKRFARYRLRGAANAL
jgi:hypothetical protein